MTSNVVAWIRAAEDQRANKAREAETHRANLVSEAHARNVLAHEHRVLAEQARHNYATENEAQRANRAREAENTRAARAQERLSSERNVLQARENQIAIQRTLAETSAKRYATSEQTRLGFAELGANRWRNQQDILNTQRRITSEYSIAQQQIQSQERMKSQEIAQRATAAWQQYQLGQDKLSQEWKLKLLDTGANLLKKVDGKSLKNLWNSFQMLGY